jgi:hypothetical protein
MSADNAFTHGDYEAALAIWEPAARGGDRHAQNRMGIMYHLGLGVRRDSQKALHWYRKAAIGGDPDAQRNLGAMYLAGQDIARDEFKAYAWFHVAAAGGNRAARLYLEATAGTLTPNQIMHAKAWVHQFLNQANRTDDTTGEPVDSDR